LLEAVIEIITQKNPMTNWSRECRQQGETVGFVPTMGFLHEGHLSLIREAHRHADRVVVSIFVNPTQFAPGEDFDDYPRNLDRDIELCRREGTSAVFTPDADALYPEGFETQVGLKHLPRHLCGLSRPHFFGGVATVVTKLFNIVRPDAAVFGMKDFQQLAVIRRMVRDLDMGIRIIGAPIVREPDGLAMSSRNAYVSPSTRRWTTPSDDGERLSPRAIRTRLPMPSPTPFWTPSWPGQAAGWPAKPW
jgi:pantoate--beta-alanine ligase